MNYLLIATALLYAGVAQLIEKIGLRAAFGALIVVALPEIVRLLLLYIYAPDVSPLLQLGIVGVIKLVLQFIVMLVTFTLLKQREEEIVGWWLCLGIGMIVSILVIPAAVQRFFAFL